MIFQSIKYKTLVGFICCFAFAKALKAQEDPDSNLGTEVVNVVKPYSPTISDAFKVKATPQLNDSITTAKKTVTYSIFSVPVASTFTPAKGKAAGIKKEPKAKYYDNYATLGGGNFTTALAELYSNFKLSKTQDFSVFLKHNSSQGGIDDVLVDDDFYDTRLKLNYGAREKKMSWRVGLDGKHQSFNWYGIAQEIVDLQNLIDPSFITEDTDVAHSYITGGINGGVQFNDAFFEGATIDLRYFQDSENNNELRAVVKPTVVFPIAGENITTGIEVDYLDGSFDNEFTGAITANDYSILNAGISPNLEILHDDLSLNIGFAAFVSNESRTSVGSEEVSDTDIFVYPRVSASYRVVGDYFIGYAGVDGDLHQNNYHDFAQENPFIAPDQRVQTTDKQYDGYLGMKGKLSNSLSFNLRANYASEINKPLFVNNDSSLFAEGAAAWLNGNSFTVAYDDVETFGVFGELNIDVNSKFKMKINGQFSSYTTDRELEAWNLPDITASIFGDYQITKQWFTGVNLFFVGERQDLGFAGNSTTPVLSREVIVLENYFDINAHVGYRVNDRLSTFARVNNILDNDYERWQNYQVQGLQGLIGATYKFDF